MDLDEGSIVLGWLTKLVLVLGVLGFLGFDGMAVATASFTAQEHADNAASAAADRWKGAHDLQKSYDAGLAVVAADGDTIDTRSFLIAPDGRVTLVLHRTAKTLWLAKISALKHFATVSADGAAAPSS